MRYTMDAQCRSCDNEQQHLVDMSEDPDDREVEAALEEQAHECEGCGDMDWVQLTYAPQKGV